MNDGNADLTTTFNVEDVTGDDRFDVRFNLSLQNDITGGTTSVPAGFVKTGEGTMVLANNGLLSGSTPGKFRDRVFSGDIEVREGELRLAEQNSAGDVTCRPRTLTVSTNATLHLACRNAIYTPKNVPQLAVVIDHGTLRVSSDETSPTDTRSAQAFGDLTLDNATLDYADTPGNAAKYGKFWFGGKVTLKGETPYVFAPKAGVASMGFNLNNEPLTEFNVADITTNDDVDVTFNHDFLDRYTDTNDMTHASGFVKTGPGTMRIASQCAYRGDTLVSNGVFKVDGSVGCRLQQAENAFPAPTRTIYVSEGAALSGTGSVYNVSIEAGGGFEITAGQSVPLKITGDLSLSETGFINIRNPLGLEDVDELTGEVATVAGTTAGASNIESWPVRVEGELVKTFHPYMQGDRLYIRNLNGTVILFR